MRQLGVRTEIKGTDFSSVGWQIAVETARRARGISKQICVVTAFPTGVPNASLAAILQPWPEFEVASNCTSSDELTRAIIKERPVLVAVGHQLIGAIATTRDALRAQGVSEPRWMLMLSHIDPSTLLSAAIAGLDHMFTSDQLVPAERFADQLRGYANNDVRGESPLSRTFKQLQIAVDDDDRKILQLLVDGDTNHEIAEKVFFAEQTVKNRLSRLMKAAGVSNRTELAMLFATSTVGSSKGASLAQ